MKKTKLFLLLLGGLISAPMFSQICSPLGSGNNNSFDWESTPTCVFYLSSNNGVPSYISNPFFASGTTCNNYISPFCNLTSPNNDISSADGWAYVTHDFGQPNNTIECPVFILYNIYSGMLRVFFYKSLTTPGNSSVIALDYSEGTKRTALLENYGGVVKNAVQVFDNTNKSVLVPNNYLLSPSWTHADFVTQYDPCTCQSTSAYTFKLVSTSNSNISFTINGQIKQDIKVNQNGTQGLTVKTGTDGLTAIENLFGIGSGSAPNNFANIFNDLSGYFSKIGKVVKFADFFFGLFKNNSNKVTPLIFNANLTGSGNIQTNNPLQEAPLNNPGSNLSNVTVVNRPAYNNIMGTFNLLKAPQIKINTFSTNQDLTIEDPNGYGYCSQQGGVSFAQLECTEPIKWVLNPSSGLSVDKLHASYVIEFANSERFETGNFPLECFLNYKPKFFLGNWFNSSCEWSFSSDIITQVYLRITGNFAAGNNQKFVYSSFYNVSITENTIGAEPIEQLPDQSCTAITPSASFSEIQAVCNSSQYTSRRDQFYKAPTNENNDFTLKNSAKNNIEMVVSPNPASNIVNLQYSVKTTSNIKIGIYDLAGKMIKDVKNEKNVAEGYYDFPVDLANVSSGLYTVVIESNGEKIVKKLSVLQK
jgi:Secretion system C-terminal sorting domain